MFMKKIKICLSILAVGLLLSACAQRGGWDWEYDYQEAPVSETPVEMAPGFYYGEYTNLEEYAEPEMYYAAEQYSPDIKTVAVLLPLSGANAALGKGIQHAIEIAFFQKQPKDVMVAFNDLSGTAAQKAELIDSVITRQPDMILGPIFSDDVELLRSMKPDWLPALTFTSDAAALGNGVFTFALLPNQGVEAIVKHMAAAGDNRVLILAPDTKTGYMLANAALESAGSHNVRAAGLYYYREGEMGAMKSTAEKAAMFGPRESANRQAKEILADVLMTKQMTPAEKASVSAQLDALNKTDTVGKLPYDAVLFLGGANDSKALASFLRYFDVPTNTVKFYGTAMWDADTMFGDLTMSGAEYASLPAISPDFVRIYSEIEGVPPNRMNTMGYDAAMLAVGALSSDDTATYLLDPSGYKGLDGLVRLRLNGTDERALQIMKLDGSGAPKLKAQAAGNFKSKLYKTPPPSVKKPYEIELRDGFDAMDYIQLPDAATGRYRTQTYRLSGASDSAPRNAAPASVVVLPEDDSYDVMAPSSDWSPNQLDGVDRRLIDSVEVTTRR